MNCMKSLLIRNKTISTNSKDEILSNVKLTFEEYTNSFVDSKWDNKPMERGYKPDGWLYIRLINIMKWARKRDILRHIMRFSCRK